MNRRLQNEAAFAMAQSMLRIVRNCVPKELHREAFDRFYRVCLSGIQDYHINENRMMKRLRPGRN
jgi:hypothetical protein